MGFKFFKKNKVLDLRTAKFARPEEVDVSVESKPEPDKQGFVAFDFFGNPSPSSSSSSTSSSSSMSSDDSLKINRKIEGISNRLSRLLDRIELLEKKVERLEKK